MENSLYTIKTTQFKSLETVTTDINELNPIHLNFVRSNDTIPAKSLWYFQGALVYLLRRAGCWMERKNAQELSKLKPIMDRNGIRMIAITHTENIELEDFQKYWCGEIFYDKEEQFFKATGNRLAPLTFTDYRCWHNLSKAVCAGINGDLRGNAKYFGDILLIGPKNAGVIYEQKEQFAGQFYDTEILQNIVENFWVDHSFSMRISPKHEIFSHLKLGLPILSNQHKLENKENLDNYEEKQEKQEQDRLSKISVLGNIKGQHLKSTDQEIIRIKEEPTTIKMKSAEREEELKNLKKEVEASIG